MPSGPTSASRTLRAVPPDQPGLTLDAPPEADDAPAERRRPRPPAAPAGGDANRSRRLRRRPKIVARKVRRVVRRVDAWSVLRVSLIFYVCCYIVTMVAGVLLWSFGYGVVEKIESFIEDYGSFEVFEFDGELIFEGSLLVGGVFVVLLTGLTVLGAILFNLISDLVGGIRITVLEEETARPAPSPGDTVTRSKTGL